MKQITLQDLGSNDIKVIDELIQSGCREIAYAKFPTGEYEIFDAAEYIGSTTGYFDQTDVTIFNRNEFSNN